MVRVYWVVEGSGDILAHCEECADSDDAGAEVCDTEWEGLEPVWCLECHCKIGYYRPENPLPDGVVLKAAVFAAMTNLVQNGYKPDEDSVDEALSLINQDALVEKLVGMADAKPFEPAPTPAVAKVALYVSEWKNSNLS